MTLPKFPFPRTARKLKSSSPTFRLRAGGRLCGGDNATACPGLEGMSAGGILAGAGAGDAGFVGNWLTGGICL